MELRVRGTIVRGKIITQKAVLSMENVSNNGIFGGKFTKQYPHPCGRCNGKIFHICMDGDDYVSFCANQSCLKEDSDISRGKETDDRRKQQEKNDFGQIVTGAEKFRMGSEYKRACLSSWLASREHHDVVKSWFHDSRPFLVVMGSTGVGKTFLAAAILNWFFEKKEEIHYTTHRRFVEEMHVGIEIGKTQHFTIDKFSHKRILILDDLGSASNTEWQKEQLLELIDRRYSDNLKTLITTNFNEKQISDDLGKRTCSRLLDKKNSILEFWTEDKRRHE